MEMSHWDFWLQGTSAFRNGIWVLTTPYFLSVRTIPRVSNFTGEDNDPSNPAELNELAVRVIKEEHERLLAKLKQ
jgi:hypothetical protein